jgi:hypothetical protein
MSSYSFIGADGLTYNLSKFQFGDIVEFNRWVQYRPFHEFQLVRESIPPDIFERQCDRLIDECVHKSKDQIEAETKQYAKTIEGVSYMVFLALKRNHPTLKESQIQNIITEDNATEIGRLIGIVNPSVKKNTEATAETPNHSTQEHSIESVSKSE